MTKTVITSILSGAFTFFLFYLLGAFITTTFNISQWSETARVVVGVFGGFFSLTVICCILIHKITE
jgi:hypothetical protein